MRKSIFHISLVALLLWGFAGGECLAADSTRSAFAETVIASRYITVPVGTIVGWTQRGTLIPELGTKWLECNGQAVPTDSDLYKQKGQIRTPNLYEKNGYFMRAGGTPQRTFEDTLRSHNHDQPTHQHEWSGELVSTAVTAHMLNRDVTSEAEAQYYGDNTAVGSKPTQTSGGSYEGYAQPDPGDPYSRWMGFDWHVYNSTITCSGGNTISCEVHPKRRVYLQEEYHQRETEGPSKVDSEVVNGISKGIVNDGTVRGVVHASGDDPTYYTSLTGGAQSGSAGEISGTENAPTHYTTRYYIRIND